MVLTINETGELVLPECININKDETIIEEVADLCIIEDSNNIDEDEANAQINEKVEEPIHDNRKEKPFYAGWKFWLGNLTGGVFTAGAIYLGKKIISKFI